TNKRQGSHLEIRAFLDRRKRTDRGADASRHESDGGGEMVHLVCARQTQALTGQLMIEKGTVAAQSAHNDEIGLRQFLPGDRSFRAEGMFLAAEEHERLAQNRLFNELGTPFKLDSDAELGKIAEHGRTNLRSAAVDDPNPV